MPHLKTRLLALALIVVSVGLNYFNWRQLSQEGTYSLKLAAFAPLLVIGGIYLLLVPSGAGKPTTTREKLIAMIVFAIGLVAGLVNWYLMDPGYFGR